MYSEFKALGLDNRSAALVLIDTDHAFGEVNMRERIESRDRLSRTIVHAKPGDIHPELFNDFALSSQVLLRVLIDKLKAKKVDDPRTALLERFSGPAAQNMMAALKECRIDPYAYANTLDAIARLERLNDFQNALLYLILFVATGCTGDPLFAAQTVERFALEELNEAFLTPEPGVYATPETQPRSEDLALVRIIGGQMKGGSSFYVLTKRESGTEIGTLATGSDAIRDVDEDVSRHHARVFERDGHWFVEDLGSTNGTSVIAGSDKVEHVVQEPRRKRKQAASSDAYEIFPTDTLCLGATTRFMVIPVAN